MKPYKDMNEQERLEYIEKINDQYKLGLENEYVEIDLDDNATKIVKEYIKKNKQGE